MKAASSCSSWRCAARSARWAAKVSLRVLHHGHISLLSIRGLWYSMGAAPGQPRSVHLNRLCAQVRAFCDDLGCALRRTCRSATSAQPRGRVTSVSPLRPIEQAASRPCEPDRFGSRGPTRLDCLAGPPRRPSHQPPQGRKAARVRELWRVRGSPFVSGPIAAGRRIVPVRQPMPGVTAVGTAAVASVRGARPLPQVPSRRPSPRWWGRSTSPSRCAPRWRPAGSTTPTCSPARAAAARRRRRGSWPAR